MVASTVGSSICTGWNRRSRAASLPIVLRYSSGVVAPTSCRPRASAGLIIWPASMLPSAFPRLKSVSALPVGEWNYNWHEGMYSRSSSMKQMTFLACIPVRKSGEQMHCAGCSPHPRYP